MFLYLSCTFLRMEMIIFNFHNVNLKKLDFSIILYIIIYIIF